MKNETYKKQVELILNVLPEIAKETCFAMHGGTAINLFVRDMPNPRDLFDVKFLLENEGFSDEVKRGFLLCLISCDRPIHEIIQPRLQDQGLALNNQFSGMSEERFTYDDYIHIRDVLINTVKNELTEYDREFLLSVKALAPDWRIYNFEKFPAVQWKLQNLQKLRSSNPDKYKRQYELLKQQLALTVV